MKLRPIGRHFGALTPALLFVASSMASPTIAGGNHHKTVLVPVQVVTVQPTQFQAAAPVAYYQVQTVAAAPVYQVAAAPVYQVAAAPLAYYQMQPAAAPVKAAPAPMQVTYGGLLYNRVAASGAAGASPAVGASPSGIDGLSEEDRRKILDRLTPFVAIYEGAITDKTVLRSTVRSKAADLYADVTGKDADSTQGEKAITNIIAQALGEALTTTTTPDPNTPTPTTPNTAQPIVVPVAPAPATMQLFLPVRVKHHGRFSYD